MSVKIKINWDNENVVSESVQIYRADSVFTSTSLPPLLAEIFGDIYEYEDLTTVEGRTYFYMLSTKLGEQEVFTECFEFTAQAGWSPTDLTKLPFFLSVSSKNTISSNGIVVSFDSVGSQLYKFTPPSQSGSPVVSGDFIMSSETNKNLRSQGFGSGFYEKSEFWGFFVVKRPANTITRETSIFAVPLESSGGYTYPSPAVYFSKDGMLVIAARKRATDVITTIQFPVDFNGGSDTVFFKIDWDNNLIHASINGGEMKTAIMKSNPVKYQPLQGASTLLFITTTTSILFQTGVGIGAMIVGTNDDIPIVDEIDKLSGWAAHKFAITDKLPINHPYKTVKPV